MPSAFTAMTASTMNWIG